jgi:hypothetical protein
MVAIPLPLTSTPGHRGLQEAGGRLINCYAVPVGESAKRVRVPGMTAFLTSTETGFRGMYSVGGTLYVAFKDKLFTGTSLGGPLVFFDDLPGDQSVYFAANNQLPPDLAVVTEDGAFLINDPGAPGTVIPYPGGILPQPSTVCAFDGYFLFTVGDGRVFASDLNSTVINALSFARLEARPDRPVRGVPFAGRALFFGSQSLEVWTDVGALPFPLQRASVIPFGLLGPDAVAGWEDGWGAGLLWVAHDRTVRMLNGYTADKVSPPDLDELLERDPHPELLLASVYVTNGHPMLTVTGSNFSWSFDVVVQKWHERASYLTDRWRGLQTWSAFGYWLVGDRGRPDPYLPPGTYIEQGNIYRIDAGIYTEAGEPLRMRLESGAVAQFPMRVRVARADFDLETGVGIATGVEPIETDPVVEISWSDDGLSWSNPRRCKLGRQSVDQRISVFRTGMSSRHGRRWRIEVADPVYVSIMAGDQSVEPHRG